MKKLHYFSALLGMALLVGCSSIHSTYLKRNKEMCGWETKHLHGVPITLEVPHTYKIDIIETYYAKKGNFLRETVSKIPVTTLDVCFEVVDTKEVFTVDFVKPGAGVLKTNVELDQTTQYFSKIDNEIQDNTIEEITKSIKAIRDSIKLQTLSDNTLREMGLAEYPKTIASIVIDVSDPLANQKIQEFLCSHLNNCTNCGTRPGSRLPTSRTEGHFGSIQTGTIVQKVSAQQKTNSARMPY